MGLDARRVRPLTPVAAEIENRPAASPSQPEVRALLAERLRERWAEIERSVLTRAYSISDPTVPSDPDYLLGLHEAVAVTLEYGLSAIESSGSRDLPVPTKILAQARMAARSDVSLEAVLRRYFAGYSLLGDFLVEEAERAGVPAASLQRLMRSLAMVFDGLVTAVGEEHTREAHSRAEAGGPRLGKRIERLLEGELIETSDLTYDFGAHHVGLAAAGPGVEDAIRARVASIDCRLLVVDRADGTAWAWLGSRRPLDPAELQHHLSFGPRGETLMALGEPAQGLQGWRLTNRQARAALSVVRRGAEPVVRYSRVALLASILRDDLLSASLRHLYLIPLEADRDGGVAAKDTLRAYFAADRNVSSAASALGLSRQTVTSRLRAIQARLGCDLETDATQMELALQLEGTDAATSQAAVEPRLSDVSSYREDCLSH